MADIVISQMMRQQDLFHVVNVSSRAFGIKKFRHRLHQLPDANDAGFFCQRRRRQPSSPHAKEGSQWKAG
jgi:hypothetical protein